MSVRPRCLKVESKSGILSCIIFQERNVSVHFVGFALLGALVFWCFIIGIF